MKPRNFPYFTLPALIVVSPLAIHQAHADDITWDSGGADDNWSTPANWSDDADPSGDDIIFDNTGGAAGTTVTNIVDADHTIDSLNLRQDNTVNQTLSVPGGQTLTVNGSFTPTTGEATAVLFGQPSVGSTTASTTNITGLGTLTVNSATNHFLVGYATAGGGITATLNMSGLSNFNATANVFGVGRKGTTSADASRQQAGILTLSKSSTITANEISVGSTTHIGGTTGTHNNSNTSTFNLGSGGSAVNNLFADRFNFGIGKAVGNMNFAAGVVETDTVNIRAKNTTGAVTDFIIGVRNMSSSSGTPGGTVNFGAGKVDALITNLIVGQWANGAGTSGVNPTGTFTMGTNANSTVTVTTLNLANSGSGTNPGSARVLTGNVNVTAGVLSANTVNLATGSATANLTKTANLTVDGGTFRFGTFGAPTGTHAVAIHFSNGTVASTDATSRTLGLAYNLGKIGGGTTITFGQASGGTGAVTLNGVASLLGNTTVETVQNTTLGGTLDGAFSLTKSGAATLVINQNQTWSGGTTVDSGTLKMSGNKTLAAGSSMNLAAAGTWLLDGTSQTLGELTGTGLVSSTWATSGFDTLTIGSGDATSTFDGAISGGDGTSIRGIHLAKTGTGTFTLNGPNTFRGNVIINGTDRGDLVATRSDSFGVGPKNIQAAGNTGANRPTLVFNGSGGDLTFANNLTFQTSNDSLTDPAIRNLAGANKILGTLQLTSGGGSTAIVVDAGSLELADVTNTSTARNLRLAGAANGTVSGIISDGTGTVGIEKFGAGTWTLANANTYTGATVISAGALVLGAAGLIADSTAITLAAGATLETLGQASFAMSATQPVAFGIDSAGAGSSGRIVADGLNISAAVVTFNVTGTLDDPAYILATYTSKSGAAFASATPPSGYTIDYAHNGGTQIALVPLATTGFANWLTLHPDLPDTTLGGDPENDGIENLLEYILDGDPQASDPDILPILDASGANFIFTFTRREESASDTTQIFQYGSDLSGWIDLNITAPTAAEVTLGTPSGGLQTVTVTIPKGSNTRLFGRLRASQP